MKIDRLKIISGVVFHSYLSKLSFHNFGQIMVGIVSLDNLMNEFYY